MTAFPLVPPIAHRGLHDVRRGVIENTASAFRAAIAARYAIETDIQAAASDEPVIFHDERLDRLTEANGLVRDRDAAALGRLALRGTGDRIMTLAELLSLVNGRVPLFLEIKHAARRDTALERRVANDLADYAGPVFVMGFDPASMGAMRTHAPSVPRGLSAMRFWQTRKHALSETLRFRLTHMLDIPDVKPDFLTYQVDDLAVMGPALRRRIPDLPILCWTVKTAEQRRRAARFADGMIFEGFRPNANPNG